MKRLTRLQAENLKSKNFNRITIKPTKHGFYTIRIDEMYRSDFAEQVTGKLKKY